jgi:hypothetical protein
MRRRHGAATFRHFPRNRTCCVARRLCYILTIGEEYVETTLRRDGFVAQMRRIADRHSRPGDLVLLAYFLWLRSPGVLLAP